MVMRTVCCRQLDRRVSLRLAGQRRLTGDPALRCPQSSTNPSFAGRSAAGG